MSLFLVPWLLLAAPSQATPPASMVGGETTSAHPAVGALVVCSGDRCASFCSGTLVDRRWVLTAGHCVEAMLEDYGHLAVSFATGGDVRWGEDRDELVAVDGGLMHPQYREMEHDIGLVKLAVAIDGVTQPVSMSAPEDTWLDTPLRYVGYGVTSDDADDAGVKRRADIPLQSWDDQWLMAADPTGEANLCWGDSGGAAMLPLDGGGWALVGVQSWIWDDDDTPCTGGSSGAARVDAHLEWLSSEAPMNLVVIERDVLGEDDSPEDDEEEDPEDVQEDDETGNEDSDDTGWVDDDERDDSEGSGTIPSNDPELEAGNGGNGGSIRHAQTGCNTAPRRSAPWIPAILAVMASLMLGRRRL